MSKGIHLETIHAVVVRPDVRGSRWVSLQRSHPVCQQRWGPTSPANRSLTALDLSQLASLAYERDCAVLRRSTVGLFSPRRVEKNCSLYDDLPRVVVFDFEGTRVVSFKGTSTIADANLDASLWSTIWVMQQLDRIYPVVEMFAVDQLQWLLQYGVLPGQRMTRERFWDNVTRQVAALADEAGNREMVLTGHSLGGGIAQVIAARLGYQALVFSAPGILYSTQTFGVYNRTFWSSFYHAGSNGPDTSHGALKLLNRSHPHGVQNAKRLVTVVVPDGDQVPRVDKQLGLVHRIECRECPKVGEACEPYPASPFRVFGDMAGCHSLGRTSCELWRICGDEQQRSWDCDKYVSTADIGRTFNPDDTE